MAKSEEFSLNKASYQSLWGECIDMAGQLPGMYVEQVVSVVTCFSDEPPKAVDNVRLRWQANAQQWNAAFVVEQELRYESQAIENERPAHYQSVIAAMTQPQEKVKSSSSYDVRTIRDYSPNVPSPLRAQAVEDCLQNATWLSWEFSPHLDESQAHRYDYLITPDAQHASTYRLARHTLSTNARGLSAIAIELAETTQIYEPARYRALELLLSYHVIGEFITERTEKMWES